VALDTLVQPLGEKGGIEVREMDLYFGLCQSPQSEKIVATNQPMSRIAVVDNLELQRFWLDVPRGQSGVVEVEASHDLQAHGIA
jgi:hypothetical protein